MKPPTLFDLRKPPLEPPVVAVKVKRCLRADACTLLPPHVGKDGNLRCGYCCGVVAEAGR